MPSPVTPAQLKAIIVDPGSSLCGNFVAALLKLPTYAYQIANYIFDTDGNFNTAFKKLVTDLSLRPGDLIFSGRLNDSDGRLLCNGAAVSRTTYADLFAAIGTTFGAGDGVTTFNVPNYQDHFPIGASGTKPAGTAIGDGADDQKITLVESNLPRHTHYIGVGVNPSITVPNGNGALGSTGGPTSFNTATATTKAGETRDNGSNTPATQTKVTVPLPPCLPAYVYVKT